MKRKWFSNMVEEMEVIFPKEDYTIELELHENEQGEKKVAQFVIEPSLKTVVKSDMKFTKRLYIALDFENGECRMMSQSEVYESKFDQLEKIIKNNIEAIKLKLIF